MTKINYLLLSVLLCILIVTSSSAEQRRGKNHRSPANSKRKLQADAPLPKKTSGKVKQISAERRVFFHPSLSTNDETIDEIQSLEENVFKFQCATDETSLTTVEYYLRRRE